MSNIILPKELTVLDKLNLMEKNAQYEIADMKETDCDELEDLDLSHIRCRPHQKSFPKVFVSNDCIFNCAYCSGRREGGCQRFTFTPREAAEMSMNIARKSGGGVFITSGIYRNSDYTEELICETARIMREEFNYTGFIHAKVMPGTDMELIKKTGKYANRLSVNIETANSIGYARIAHEKNRKNILSPMRDISNLIQEAKYNRGLFAPKFATSQTTQLMAGSIQEDDRTIMNLSKALYDKYKLSRVYYTGFYYRHPAEGYDIPVTITSPWRVKRLYQADRLMQLYGFTPDDITPADSPNLDLDIDPKISYALRHMDMFPVEINNADYETLIRIPGIGTTYAKKIIHARRSHTLTHDLLRRIRIPMKRCLYFITCNGKYEGGHLFDNAELLREVLRVEPVIRQRVYETDINGETVC